MAKTYWRMADMHAHVTDLALTIAVIAPNCILIKLPPAK